MITFILIWLVHGFLGAGFSYGTLCYNWPEAHKKKWSWTCSGLGIVGGPLWLYGVLIGNYTAPYIVKTKFKVPFTEVKK